MFSSSAVRLSVCQWYLDACAWERDRERETERERNSDAEDFSDLKRKNKIVKNVNRVRFVE